MRAKSKRVTSATRHKIDRKKRENKRDIRKAARQMSKNGIRVKSKKSRTAAKDALKVSMHHPDKEKILQNVLEMRANARLAKAERRAENRKRAADGVDAEESGSEVEEEVPVVRPTNKMPRHKLLFAGKEQENFATQLFGVADMCASLLITVDARAASQSLPLSVLDALSSMEFEEGQEKQRRVLIVLTKVDLVSRDALLAAARDVAKTMTPYVGSGIAVEITVFSTYFDRTTTTLLKAVRRNLGDKIIGVTGLPNTGKTSVCRALEAKASDVAIIPSRTLLVNKTTGDVHIPGQRGINLLTLPDDAQLKRCEITAGDAIFHAKNFVARQKEPEIIGLLLADGFDQVDLCQHYGMALCDTTQAFLQALGRKVQREYIRSRAVKIIRKNPLRLGAHHLIQQFFSSDFKWSTAAPTKSTKYDALIDPSVLSLMETELVVLPKTIFAVKPSAVVPEDYELTLPGEGVDEEASEEGEEIDEEGEEVDEEEEGEEEEYEEEEGEEYEEEEEESEE